MKTNSLTILMLFSFFCSYAQLRNYDLSKLEKRNISKARKAHLKCVATDIVEFFEVKKEVKSLDYITVASFKFSKDFQKYEGKTDLSDYLELSKKSTISDFIVLKNGQYEGCMSFSNIINFETSKLFCNYSDDKEFRESYYETDMYHLYSFIKESNIRFLFTVEGIRNCIWFIQDDRISILDLKKMEVSEPLDFINNECSVDHLKNWVSGETNTYCY